MNDFREGKKICVRSKRFIISRSMANSLHMRSIIVKKKERERMFSGGSSPGRILSLRKKDIFMNNACASRRAFDFFLQKSQRKNPLEKIYESYAFDASLPIHSVFLSVCLSNAKFNNYAFGNPKAAFSRYTNWLRWDSSSRGHERKNNHRPNKNVRNEKNMVETICKSYYLLIHLVFLSACRIWKSTITFSANWRLLCCSRQIC